MSQIGYVPLVNAGDGDNLPLSSSGDVENHSDTEIAEEEANTNRFQNIKWWIKIGVAVLVFAACIGIYFAPFLKNDYHARHCLAIVIFVITLWATELLPIWATSTLIPILVVWLDVFPAVQPEPGKKPEPAAVTAANIVFSKFFGSPVLLALGAFTMSAALTKYELSDRLAWLVLSRVPRRPWLVALTVMFLGVFLSMWVSNVAAPVVVVSLVRPLISQMPTNEPFVKLLLLGIAFSNNIGGMTTPIASPQNIVCIDEMHKAKHPIEVGWGPWLGVALPFSIVCTFATFGALWLFYRPKLAEVPPMQERVLKPFGWRHMVVLFVSFSTILLWALSSLTESATGNNGITAFLPVLIFCGTKILTKDDFKALSWDVLVLLSGGIVLGTAIDKSGLLDIIATEISKIVAGKSIWIVMMAFASLTWLFGNFMSHTVAAIIIAPVIVAVTCTADVCVPKNVFLVTVGAILVDSGAMALPMTSFPNVAVYNELDEKGEPILDTNDFMKTGFPIGVVELLLLFSLGFGLFMIVPL